MDDAFARNATTLPTAMRCSLMTIVIVFFSFGTFAIRPCVTTRRLAIFSAASALSSHSFLLIELILIYKHISSSVLVVVLLRIPLLCNKSSLYLSLCTTTTASLVLVVPRSSPLHVHTPLRVLQKRSGIFVEPHRVSLDLLRSETISLQASFI